MIKQLQHPFLLLWVRVVLARPQLQSKVFFRKTIKLSRILRGKKRLDEVDGVDYYFETKSKFSSLD